MSDQFEGNYLGEVEIKMDEYRFRPKNRVLPGVRFHQNEHGFGFTHSKVAYVWDSIRNFFWGLKE
jgi:hypothetical protein